MLPASKRIVALVNVIKFFVAFNDQGTTSGTNKTLTTVNQGPML
jgi:hypothetical protein